MTSNEQWRPAPGFPDYLVSDLGRVRTVRFRHPTALMKPQRRFGTAKYLHVDLTRDGETWIQSVHRLVAAAFCERREGADVVNHLNGKKADNRAVNLEWCTPSENVQHARDVLGAKFGSTKLRSMNAKPLTEANIKAAQPGDVLKDAVVQGLQLRCFAQSKGYYLYFRTANGTQRKPKLGSPGQITLTQAREAARKMLGAVSLGEDPAAARAEARKELTLDELWSDYKERPLKRMKPTTQDQYQRRYNRSLKAKFGSRKLSDISHQAVEEHHAALGREHPVEANHAVILMSGMFTFALSKKVGWKGENPCVGVQRFPEQKRRRYMRGEEPARIAQILDQRAKRSPATVAFIYLLILSGARKSEIAAARWEWLEGNVLNLPDSKTGRKQVYLPPHALDVINRLPRSKPTIVGISRPDNLWASVRIEAGCPDLRLHDLRHSFASAAIGAGFTLAQIGELLGHKNTQTTQRYAHLVEDAAVAAATVTADALWLKMKKTVEPDSRKDAIYPVQS